MKAQADLLQEKENDFNAKNAELLANYILTGGQESETLSEELTKAEIERNNAETEYLQALVQKAEDQKNANAAILDEYNKQMQLLDLQHAPVQNQKGYNEAVGKRRTRDDIQAERDALNQNRELIRNTLNELSLDDYEGPTAEIDFQTDKAALEKALNDTDIELFNLRIENMDFDTTELKYGLDDL